MFYLLKSTYKRKETQDILINVNMIEATKTLKNIGKKETQK